MTMAATSILPAIPREIPIRTPELDFETPIPNHWLAGNAVATHIFNGMNLVFPDGERFFIQAVRDCMAQVEDPELVRQVRAFYGQEACHAREHERYFQTLERQGYQIQPFLRRFRAFIGSSTRFLPAPLRLSLTAGAEHYTATFGAFALEDAMLAEAHPTMRRLILWHATEEIEHKHVAFDVLRATHPSHLLRVSGYALATFDLFAWGLLGARMLIRQDLAAGRLTPTTRKQHAADLRERRSYALPWLKERVAAYWRRDFHPCDTDELPLAHRKLAELGIA